MNWKEAGALALARDGLHLAAGEHLQGVWGSGTPENPCRRRRGRRRRTDCRTDAPRRSRAVAASTQWMVAPFTLRPSAGIAAPGLGVVLSEHFGHIAVLVLAAAGAADEVGALQAALRAVGIQALVLGDWGLQEVLRLDIELPGEGDGAGARPPGVWGCSPLRRSRSGPRDSW